MEKMEKIADKAIDWIDKNINKVGKITVIFATFIFVWNLFLRDIK